MNVWIPALAVLVVSGIVMGSNRLKPGLSTNRIPPMTYEVCPKCYGTKNPGHECGPKTLAKDDLCPKCLIILEDCSKALFHYAKDMLQIDRLVRGADDDSPPSAILDMVKVMLERREERILKEMEDGKIKRG